MALIGNSSKGGGVPKAATYTPDYQSILNSDPAYSALKANISAQGISDAANRKATTNQDLINFGAVPNFAAQASSLGLSPQALAMLQSDIDPATAGLAAGNQYSTEAQLARQNQQAMLALRNNLAARGGISSGEDAYQTGNQDYAYGQAQQSALMQLLGAITGAQSTFTTNQQNEQGQLSSGLQTAEATDSGLPQYSPFSLNYNPKTGKYVGPSGESFTPTKAKNGGWLLTDDATGLHYTLNPNGTLSYQ